MSNSLTDPNATTSTSLIAFGEMEKMAEAIAKSGMFGIKNSGQAMVLMMLCQADGMHPIKALQQYHLMNNRPTMRSDAMQAKFENAGGHIIWHFRTKDACAATFLAPGIAIDKEVNERATQRLEALELTDDKLRRKALMKASRNGEETVLRTMAEAQETGIATTYNENEGAYVLKDNWQGAPRAMLTSRAITEGIRVVLPALIVGIYSPEEAVDIFELELKENARLAAIASAAPDERQLEAMKNIQSAAEAGGDVTAARDMAARIEKVESGGAKPSETLGPIVTQDNWEEVQCHMGKAGGPMLGKTMGEICGPEVPLTRAFKLSEWMREKLFPGLEQNIAALGKKATNEDVALCAAIKFACAAVAVRAAKIKAEPDPAPAATSEVLPPGDTPAKSAAPPVKTAPAPAVAQPAPVPVTLAPRNWREVPIPCECGIRGKLLGDLPPIGDYGPVEVLKEIKEQIIDNPEAMATAPEGLREEFLKAYAEAEKELALQGGKPEVMDSLRALSDALQVSEAQICNHLESLGLLPAVQPTPKIKHFANYPEENLREIIRQWPTIEHEIRMEFNLLAPGETEPAAA